MAKKFSFQLNPLEQPATRDILRANTGYREIPIDLIDFDPEQPRKAFDPKGIEDLAQSIKEVGLLTPILVRETASGRFTVISGERRVRACRIANLTTIPAIVYKHGNDDLKRLVSQIVENVQREDLKPLERAQALAQLRDNFGLSIRQIAEKVGLSKSQVQRSLQLLDLPPELHQLLMQGVSESKVLELAKLRHTKYCYQEVLDRSRDEIRSLRTKSSQAEDPKIGFIVKKLQVLLGKRSKLQRKKSEIVVNIFFNDLDDVLEFIQKLETTNNTRTDIQK